ncbi:MAG: sodium/proline symporter [Leptolyngbyaceae bacterium]|nr:sodium/proline symporter [Leptolyngbyaceae bacterium]
MTDSSISITFITFIALFIGVGIYSGTRTQDTTEDYLLAGRSVNPWLMALSAVATGNSGFMFIGLIGFTYTIGISAIWLTVGYIVGDLLAWLSVHRRLREVSEEVNSETVSAFLGHGSKRGRWISITSAIITLFFLGIYAAAQLQAGSKALSVLFGWDSWIGIVFGAVVVAIYCVSGGIRASIWVGAVQSILMMASMLLLSGVAIATCGGFQALGESLTSIDPTLIDLTPSDLQFGFWPFVIAWTVAGFGVVGQPHIMVRAMTIDSADQVNKARNVYVVFNALFSLAATAVGLTARVLLPDLGAIADAELALPELASTLLPAILVGLVLVGLFSATISTADAQILSCSSALTQDLLPKAARSSTGAKLGTLATVAIILVMALVSTDNVFVLVTFSWAALAASLGPVMVIRVLKLPLTTPVAISMMIVGIATALFWRVGLHFSDDVYEVLPGMLASMLVYAASVPFRLKPE